MSVKLNMKKITYEYCLYNEVVDTQLDIYKIEQELEEYSEEGWIVDKMNVVNLNDKDGDYQEYFFLLKREK